ncbi:fimbria/pilus periplasmic chaperone [Klebsiella huaxiensis]|uniref:Putative fimbrial chaperone YadV n=1 Tax=Klebsiella huaxiensis TaxID=2153354 RepID=A0A564KJL4_9ENTR|nr:fimbria/pilus periplasmic chaperone [Klebsiella huaxiensis]VUS69433.1 putative fimbrial chaperone YadV [Klebsiella huaxiensis]
MNIHSRRIHSAFLLFLPLFFGYGCQTHASVTMTGTRIIYDSTAKSADVQLKNNDNFPYIVTSWFDSGNIHDAPEKGRDIPFVVTPPVSRIQPNSGQVLRIVFTGAKTLPQDRESLFWFNFMQVPPSNALQGDDAEKQNKILVMLRNRVKLFYRPKGLAGDPQKMLKNLQITRLSQGGNAGVLVVNNQPYHASLTKLTLHSTSGDFTQKADIIVPFGSEKFFFNGAKPSGIKSVTITLVNDQGARISEEYPL